MILSIIDFLNANSSIFRSCEFIGIIIFRSFPHILKAYLPISVILFGIEIVSIEVDVNVKSILKSAFFSCRNLKRVEFPINSELQIIGSNVFQGSSLESILIPSNVTQINSEAFIFCHQFKKFEITSDSKLQVIEDGAFCASAVECITIPSDIILKEGWCRQTSNLKEIKIIQREKQNIFYYENKFILGKSDSNNDMFDILLFANRDMKEAVVPFFVKKICFGSFFSCEKLEKISIPSNVKKIGKSAFNGCLNLSKVEIQCNSNLQKISKYAFFNCPIKSFSIPSHVNEIGSYAFVNKCRFQIVEIEEISQLESINQIDFNFSCKIMAPPKFLNNIKLI